MPAELINQIILLLLLIAVGYVAAKRRLLDKNGQQTLSSIVIKIAIPALILSAAGNPMSAENTTNILWVIAGVIGNFAVAIPLSWLVTKALRMEKARAAVFVAVAAFPNAAFMGYPLISAYLPENGIFLASFYAAIFNIVLFSYGDAIVAGRRGFSLRKTLLNPPVAAGVAMLMLFLLQVKIPAPLQITLNAVGGLCTPLSMFTVGAMLAGIPLRELFNEPLSYVASALRLLALPSITFLILRLLPVPHEAAIVTLIMSGLPSATAGAMIALQYDRDAVFASKAILQNTLLLFGTIFYIAFLITKL